jgi:hypothetical protein
LEILGELLIQLVFEVVVELISHVVHKGFRRSLHKPLIAAVVHAILGAVAGGLSLLVFPTLMIRRQWGRWLNLAITPLVCGLLMAYIGSRRAKRNEPVLRLDRFSYGWLFAMAMATVRFAWGN